jgi:hypothetical protein
MRLLRRLFPPRARPASAYDGMPPFVACLDCGATDFYQIPGRDLFSEIRCTNERCSSRYVIALVNGRVLLSQRCTDSGNRGISAQVEQKTNALVTVSA